MTSTLDPSAVAATAASAATAAAAEATGAAPPTPAPPTPATGGPDAGPLVVDEPYDPRADAIRRFRRNKAAMAGLVWALLITVVAILASWIQRFDPSKQDLSSISDSGRLGCSLQGPSAKHWLGCDLLGRDLWSRIVHGARISMSIALATIAVSLVLQLLLGAWSGYRGGLADTIIMRTADVFFAVPYFVTVLAITTLLGHEILPLMFAIILIGWMSGARLFRAGVLQVKGMDYIEAARAGGATTSRILLHHVVPNAIQPLIASFGSSVGAAIIAESVYSFLGIGLVPPTPSWGVMVGESREYITTAPHLFFVPAGALLITTLAFTFMGDGLRDALDPKLRGLE